MVSLESVVVVAMLLSVDYVRSFDQRMHQLANPGESAEDRDHDEDAGDDARGHNRVVLNVAVLDDVHNLVNQPAR